MLCLHTHPFIQLIIAFKRWLWINKMWYVLLFRISEVKAENSSIKFGSGFLKQALSGHDAILSKVKFHIHLQRLPAYYLLNIIVPTIILALLSAFTFYVPVDSGEKLSLSITILLSFALFLLILSDNTPNISHNLPFLGKKSLNRWPIRHTYLCFCSNGKRSFSEYKSILMCLTLPGRSVFTHLWARSNMYSVCGVIITQPVFSLIPISDTP